MNNACFDRDISHRVEATAANASREPFPPEISCSQKFLEFDLHSCLFVSSVVPTPQPTPRLLVCNATKDSSQGNQEALGVTIAAPADIR